MSIQEKFEKAVNVIRNLPKNGSYQPSHELQLRFYAYYKQATEGINCHPKPSFWEVVKKAKWDAWTKLGNMTKEEAMAHYVQELRKIVETMSYTDNVAMFLNSLDNFYENVPVEDLEMLVGPVIEKIRSRPNSPLSGSPLASRDTSPARVGLSRDSSPLRLPNGDKHRPCSLETSPASSYSASPLPPDSDEDEDHFLDTQTEPDRGSNKKGRVETESSSTVVENSLTQARVFGTTASPPQDKKTQGEPSLPNGAGFCDLRKDVDHVVKRLASIEETIGNQTKKLNQRTEICNGGNSNGDVDSGTHLVHDNVLAPGANQYFLNAINNLKKDMDSLNQRMVTLENCMQGEGRRVPGLGPWWDLPVHTTIAFIAWPVLILLISRWLAARKRH